jgi:hypothetical protein
LSHAYILRCWFEEQVGPGSEAQWRFSLEEVFHERCRYGFTSLEEMVNFLESELANSREEKQIGTLKEENFN